MARTSRRGRRRTRRSASGRFVRSNPKRKSKSYWKGGRLKRRKARGARRGRRVRAGRRGGRRGSRRRGSHFRTYRSLSRRYGPRRASRLWRRRRKYVRSNPFSNLMPSMGSITGVVKDGLQVGAGWLGVNAGMMILDKVVLGNLKASMSPTVTAIVNFAARAILTGVIAKVGGRFVDSRKLALGGAFNAVYHGVQDAIAANPSVIPDAAKPLLLGYDGISDYAAVPYGAMADYAALPYGGMQGYEASPDGGVILA